MGNPLIAIANASFGGNKGAEAMLVTLILELHKQLPNACFIVEKPPTASESIYEQRRSEFGKKGIHIKWISMLPKKSIFHIMFGKISLENEIPDVLIDIGGLNFHDKSIGGSARVFLKYLPLLFKSIPIVFFTQDMGPMRRYSTRLVSSILLNKANAIFLRSNTSVAEVRRFFAKHDEKVFGPFPDSTIIMNPENKKCPGLTTNEERPIIVLSPSIILYEAYRQEYLDIIFGIIKRYQSTHQILVIVHTFYQESQMGDKHVASLIADHYPSICVIDENIDTEVLKAVIGMAEWVISSRYHVLVAALSQGVPALALGWNPKYESLMELYDVSECNFDIGKMKSSDHISCFMQNSDRLDLVNRIDAANRSAKQKVLASFKKLEDVINQILNKRDA